MSDQKKYVKAELSIPIEEYVERRWTSRQEYDDWLAEIKDDPIKFITNSIDEFDSIWLSKERIEDVKDEN